MAGVNDPGGPASPAAPTPPAGAPSSSTGDEITPVTDHPAAAPACTTLLTQTAQNTSLTGKLLGETPCQGCHAPRHEPGTGRDQSRNTPLGG